MDSDFVSKWSRIEQANSPASVTERLGPAHMSALASKMVADSPDKINSLQKLHSQTRIES